MAMGGVQASRTLLCVNLSHFTGSRAVQGTGVPDLVEAAAICARVGCKSIAVRLREDRSLLTLPSPEGDRILRQRKVS
ncbi:MAG TPA: pyridoxine 5'-phosphate synthase, partial [Syntrophorhabdaceae bacterium]|nr:pyridoxine 5'-phosphate synthase [Syntrophorhabdaceae bacterium]